MITEKLKRELKYININYDFSKSCNEDVRQEMFDKGLVDFVEGSVMLTPSGEKAIGIDVAELYGEDEEDISEGFFYLDQEGEYND